VLVQAVRLGSNTFSRKTLARMEAYQNGHFRTKTSPDGHLPEITCPKGQFPKWLFEQVYIRENVHSGKCPSERCIFVHVIQHCVALKALIDSNDIQKYSLKIFYKTKPLIVKKKRKKKL